MRGLDVFALLLAVLGVALGVEAWFAGSLLRYVLAGVVAGGLLCAPLLSILLFKARARTFWRRVLFALVPLTTALLLIEVGIRVFGEPQPAPGVLIADERLGHTLKPGTAGTDEWGFRNERVPERTGALFVGDSQTWGFFLEREESYPALFSRQSGLSAYQMAHGGYGPVHYRELVRRGLAFQPKLVVIGFYFGNDLWDANSGAGLVIGEDLRDPRRTYPPPKGVALGQGRSPNWTMAAADFIQSNCRLCGWTGEILKSGLRGSASLLDSQPGAVPFTEGPTATVLLPHYREPALDLDNENIADSLRISLRCLEDIAADCKAKNARYILLAIPTKEYCYAQWLRERSTPIPELDRLHAAENAIRRRIFATALANSFELVDLAPVCIAALADGTPIWAGNGDGHLMQNGHLAAARAIAETWSGK